MESDLVNKNVAVSVNTKIDNEEKAEKRVLTEDEVALLLESSRGGRLYPLFVIALHTGMRMGEIIGLTWDCIDFKGGVINITKTLCYLPNNGHAIYEFHPPKTKAGKRNRNMTLTGVANAFGLRPPDGKTTKKTPGIVTTRSTPKYSGRDGRTQPTAQNDLSRACMSDKELIKLNTLFKK